MSSDAWTQCPICHNLPEKWRNGIERLYGKIPEREYNDIVAKIAELKDVETVRENYEATINENGTAEFWFFARCENCGVEWTMKRENVKCKIGGVI